MSRRKAVAEDLRKVGTGLLLAGVVGIAFKPAVSTFAIVYAVAFGLVLIGAGVTVTPKED